MIWAVLACGLAVAVGVWLLVGTLRPTAPRLADPAGGTRAGVSVAAHRRAERQPATGPGRTEPGRATTTRRLADRGLYRDLEPDLRVVDYGVESVIFDQVVTTTGGVAVPVLTFMVILPLGGLTMPPVVALLLAVAGGLVGFYLPILTLRRDAQARRREFAAGLSQYMSFVDVMVSGGNSIDGSFQFAAELGQGWAWDELRFAIASASRATLAPYRALHDLGEDLGVADLTNLARRLEQTQSTGSAIGPALRSLSDTLIRDQARRAKVTDDEVTEKMTFPLMVVLFSLLTFFGIAAVTAILRASETF